MRHLLRATVILTLALSLAIAAGCVGDDDESDDTADVGLVSCRALEALDSYRYNVSVETDQSQSETAAATPTEAAPTATSAPLAALGEALADLFANFQIDGSYVGPDRSDAVLAFQGDEVELRVIGDQAWVRSGDEWTEDQASTDDLLTPVVICDEVLQELSLSLRESDSSPEDVNGVTARHYELDPAKTQDLPSLLGQEIAGGYTVDLWVAEDGRWPARLLIASAGNEDEAQFSLTMDVSDANDEGISIEAPE